MNPQNSLIKTTTWIIAACCVFIAAACEPEAEPVTIFLIPEGKHYANQRFTESLQSHTLRFQAQFDQSARYTLGDQSMQTNKNKLLGFSDCNSAHHDNSARFAWQWYNDQLEIYAYCYVNGVRVEEYIGVVPLHVPSTYEIRITPSEYIFTLNDLAPVHIPRGNVCSKGLYYILWPYFGGTLPAPHDITIRLKKLF
jgi:hypothetical protein